jgi:hypothetical protein
MKKAPALTKVQGASKAEVSKANFSAAISAVEVQEERIIAALRIRPHTTDDFRKLGIFQIGARIWGLRRKGWNIETERITVVDRDGYPHPRAGLYSLIGETEGSAA